ncbi:MAG: sodium:solute symporter family protein [Desulfurococcales archaeon]|nr:sodium:solute symporter family protein [Desulfurococcales archaeon]
MDELLTASIITLILYFVVGSLLAFASRKFGIGTSRDYFVAGYRLGGFLAAMTYATTTYSAFMMVGLVGLTYMTGVGAFGFELMYLLATITILALLAPRVWELVRERRWISPAEMLADLYRCRALGILTAAMYLVALIPYTAAQVIGIGVTVQGLGGGSWSAYLVGIALAFIVIVLWVNLGGIWSVAATDAFQGIWMIVAAVGFILWLFTWGFGDPAKFSSSLSTLGGMGLLSVGSPWTPMIFVSYTIPWLFFAITNPQVVQRLYMPRDKRALIRMVTLFAVFGLTYTIIVTMIGLMGRSLTALGTLPLIKDRDAVTPTILSYAPVWLSAIVFVSIVAAAVSTADSIILTLASTTARDLYGGVRKEVRDRSLIIVGRLTVLGLAILAVVVALLRPAFIVELSVLSSVMLLPLAPVTLVGWLLYSKLGRYSKYAAVASIAAGFTTALSYALVVGAKKALVTPIAGLPYPAVILLISTAVMLVGIVADTVPHPRSL